MLQTPACKDFFGELANSTNICVRFVKILVIEIFSSVLGLFGLIIGLLVSSKAAEFSDSSTSAALKY
jgi:F0F1-type ATP synthase membrane subunit c/vacuolar-type H+-ATPase subunit K